MEVPLLRDGDDGSGAPKNVMDTKMLNTTARETPDTVTANNDNKEYSTASPDFGPLGSKGRN